MSFARKSFALLPVCILVQTPPKINSANSPYVVIAKLVDFVPGISSASYGGYPVKLIIANTSDTERTFLMRNCSWQDGWKIDDKGFCLNQPICDANYQAHITLASGQEKVFFVQVIRENSAKRIKDSKVKFGFIELTDSRYIKCLKGIISDEYEGTPTYWSNEVILP